MIDEVGQFGTAFTASPFPASYSVAAYFNTLYSSSALFRATKDAQMGLIEQLSLSLSPDTVLRMAFGFTPVEGR